MLTIKLLALIAILFILNSCEKSPDWAQVSSAKPVLINPGSTERITVNRLSVFKDALAYGGQRGIYLIKDNQSGNEYIGVSGIGISETGSHTSGKSSLGEER